MTASPSDLRFVLAAFALAVAALLTGCAVPRQTTTLVRPPAAVPMPPPVPAPPRVLPVEAEPAAPATLPAGSYNPAVGGPLAAMLSYADRLRTLPAGELGGEIGRLGDPGDQPAAQMQLALALAQTRQPADLARAAGLMQRVGGSNAPEAQPLQPLARVLAARYQEQRRIEEERDKQAQQVRDSQRRIEQLNDRLEALRAIERSVSRGGNGGAGSSSSNAAPPRAQAAPGVTRP